MESKSLSEIAKNDANETSFVELCRGDVDKIKCLRELMLALGIKRINMSARFDDMALENLSHELIAKCINAFKMKTSDLNMNESNKGLVNRVFQMWSGNSTYTVKRGRKDAGIVIEPNVYGINGIPLHDILEVRSSIFDPVRE